MRRGFRAWGSGLLIVGLAWSSAGCRGRHESVGEATNVPVPAPVVAARVERQAQALQSLAPDAEPAKQILFGDLHVHTTISGDAFLRSLPMLQGEGARPVSAACDFARYCSDLDFWSINDHAETITQRHWQETKEAIRQCNAVAGDPGNPDVVAFLGWEWTQVGVTREEHYGHKNVIMRDIEEDRVPARPIAVPPRLLGAFLRERSLWDRLKFPLLDFANRQRYFDFATYQEERQAVHLCPPGIDTRKLPADCQEVAETPQELFEKLSQWGFDNIVIPHGTTWGLYTPAGSTWDKQLTAAQHDPTKQTLIEVHSGHGNSEEYRDWRAVAFDANGKAVCPEPTEDYLPCCWQAGELIRARCENVPAEECERRVVDARQNYVNAGQAGFQTVPGATVADWKDCGQCTDCYTPAFNYRPGGAVQYIMALTNFDQPRAPRRFRFGFMASSDNHTARPGTGYKEYGRRYNTEAAGPRSEVWRERAFGGDLREKTPESIPFDPMDPGLQIFQMTEIERQASFFLTGGLVAVHAEGRDRSAVWSALKRREVYGTSGERILLWFDLLNGPDGIVPMGAEVELATAPRFRVRAVGAFKQLPGCPEHSVHSVSPEHLYSLCRGECYNPGDERRRITRVEVVRIRPQERPGEPVARLIEDPWRRFDCPADPAGCVVEFEDPDFVAGRRDALYYVRAVQEPTLAVNAGGIRCEYDAQGRCLRAKPCYGDYRTPYDEDCLGRTEERAWSSPIWVDVLPTG